MRHTTDRGGERPTPARPIDPPAPRETTPDPRQPLDPRDVDPRDGTDPRQVAEQRQPVDSRQPTNPSEGVDPREGMDPRQGTDPRQGVDPRQGSDPRQGVDPRQGMDPRQGVDPRQADTRISSEHRPDVTGEPAQGRMTGHDGHPTPADAGTEARHAGTPGGAVTREGRPMDGSSKQQGGGASRVFTAQETESYRTRWLRVQGGFVDDPGEAVEEADKLVVDAIKSLAEHKRSLEAWRDGAQTEDLRQALRGYRAFLDRLLEV